MLAEAQTPGPSKYNFNAQHDAGGGGNEGYEDLIDEVGRILGFWGGVVMWGGFICWFCWVV